VPGVETDTLAATCGHTQVNGAPSVFAEGLSISKIGVSLAGPGVIMGPGSLTVFAEGIPISLPGDVVAPHAPCPLPPIHCAALTNPTGNATVFAGTGASVAQPDSWIPDASRADLKVLNFTITPDSLVPDTPPPPATPICNTLTPVVFSWTVKNVGTESATEFTIGLWKTPYRGGTGPFLLSREGGLSMGAELYYEETVPNLLAGKSHTGSFTLLADPEWCKNNPTGDTYWSVYPDIDVQILEAVEQNWVPAIPISV
jgi:hypothetical protein